MQKITRRQHRERPWLRWVLLAAVLAALAAVGFLLYRQYGMPAKTARTGETGEVAGFARPDREILLTPAATAEGTEETEKTGRTGETGEAEGEKTGEDALASVAVTLPDGTAWTALQTEPGVLMVHADGSVYPMKDTLAAAMLYDAVHVTARSVLAEDTAALPEPLSAYGLDPARQTVTLTYADGRVLRLSIGSRGGSEEETFYYMTVAGDPRLFTLDAATAEDFAYEAPLLRAFEQPVLHASRIDRVEVEDAGGLRAWALEADIADPDAADRWVLTAPFRYACDGEMLSNLRRNLENLTLAAWIGEATPENRAAWGFDEPRARITVHQAAGTILGVGERGAIEEQDWEDDTFELLVGEPQSDVMDRVLWAGSIWTVPHFRLAGILALTPGKSLTRYTVLTSLSNLSRLTLTAGGETHVWAVDRTGTAEADGGVTVTRDGAPLAWSVFETNYNRLLMATVSGELPEGWQPEGEPHTLFVFETETGVRHTLALSDYNGLQDAVILDGSAVFCIVRGALAFDAR